MLTVKNLLTSYINFRILNFIIFYRKKEIFFEGITDDYWF